MNPSFGSTQLSQREEIFPQNLLINLYYLEMFPQKSAEMWQRYLVLLPRVLTSCAVLPHCPSQLSNAIRSWSLCATVDDVSWHWCTLGVQTPHRRDWQVAAGWSYRCRRQFLNMTGSQGEGTHCHHDNPISAPWWVGGWGVDGGEGSRREGWGLRRDDNFHFKVNGLKLFPFHVSSGEGWVKKFHFWSVVSFVARDKR